MEGIRPFLISWSMLEAPARCGHASGKLGRRVQGKEAIASSTSSYAVLSVFKQVKLSDTHLRHLTVV